MVARELMEAEVPEIGAGLGEVAPDVRVTHRNGYRQRAWETRVGEIELVLPKKRSGPAYFPSFLEPQRRSEQAIVAVVLEAYVNGVSTRKVDRLVEELGIDGMTKDRVSALCRGLDEQVELFRQRPLEGAYPYLWLDAKVVKVRWAGCSSAWLERAERAARGIAIMLSGGHGSPCWSRWRPAPPKRMSIGERSAIGCDVAARPAIDFTDGGVAIPVRTCEARVHGSHGVGARASSCYAYPP